MGCIPFEELSKDNIPPFYVRLQDDQVGHLVYWVSTSRGSITRLKLGQVWPWDFDVQGRISSRRDNWGAEYMYSGSGVVGKGLCGSKKVPTWTDPGLPLTYTSSHKVMAGELDALKKGAALKRKSEEEAGRNACMPVKKPRLGNMGADLKKMKESAKRQKDKTAEIEKERYAGAKSELRDAVQVVDTLMRSATETEKQNAVLEAMLLKSEERYIKDTNDMFDEWLAYHEVKRKEVERIHEDHALETKTRDAKIEAMETEAKGSRARLEKEKQKVKSRDERFAQVKSRWMEEQNAMEKKFREIEDIAFDLDELSELNYDTDESDGEESDFEAEPEEAEEEAKGVKETREMKDAKGAQKQESQTPKEQESQAPNEQEPQKPKEQGSQIPREQQGLKGPTNKELKRCVEREKVKSVDPKAFVNLDEDEDEGPISSQRKAKLRSSVRSKPAQSA